ncbi:hypothetical protein E5E91_15125 [Deinococcus radiodurans R1 = ATCC 13939 = DSM 20539]|uniref:Uncharacterized protein n=1 Tax=Deinococcus radiodurans (strain ATCC 13939 / DSM 20539 / JCM 16871 / CCUG 27074 / LMG 4051 / NBRC 15346 / NCIMB 9279 / VKM B-1422 / R1) TaxID=243230 RepID=Q9RYM3_DEIRA|nr:hypothetical protein DR_A0289 [Deinococcus radiodurans R1 = ATCC 13939 = DSM 20539]QEM73082.1 hypothetical protein DXG80_14900 [Deinococcus radiodurans]UDL02127.1 hypothetical protein E5E91_15125 [Deinococcus radiodurans R1 = ATCC 13939 = DSM 20539]HCE64118.1 hypothetical protein [Deinococcus radiodurans]
MSSLARLEFPIKFSCRLTLLRCGPVPLRPATLRNDDFCRCHLGTGQRSPVQRRLCGCVRHSGTGHARGRSPSAGRAGAAAGPPALALRRPGAARRAPRAESGLRGGPRAALRATRPRPGSRTHGAGAGRGDSGP